MSMMDVCGPVFCPSCPPHKNKKGKQFGPQLECSASNYSGCGVDMANCPECGKGFQISYQVKAIDRVKQWDVDVEAQRKAEEESREAARKEEIQQLEGRLAQLKGRGGRRGGYR